MAASQPEQAALSESAQPEDGPIGQILAYFETATWNQIVRCAAQVNPMSIIGKLSGCCQQELGWACAICFPWASANVSGMAFAIFFAVFFARSGMGWLRLIVWRPLRAMWPIGPLSHRNGPMLRSSQVAAIPCSGCHWTSLTIRLLQRMDVGGWEKGFSACLNLSLSVCPLCCCIFLPWSLPVQPAVHQALPRVCALWLPATSGSNWSEVPVEGRKPKHRPTYCWHSRWLLQNPLHDGDNFILQRAWTDRDGSEPPNLVSYFGFFCFSVLLVQSLRTPRASLPVFPETLGLGFKYFSMVLDFSFLCVESQPAQLRNGICDFGKIDTEPLDNRLRLCKSNRSWAEDDHEQADNSFKGCLEPLHRWFSQDGHREETQGGLRTPCALLQLDLWFGFGVGCTLFCLGNLIFLRC